MIEADELTIQNILAKSIKQLEQAGIPSFRYDAETIIADILQIPRLELFFKQSQSLSQNEYQQITDLVMRRSQHQPLQYLLKKAYFRHLELTVGPGVLIPRPETELIIDIVADHLKPGSKVCDVGTGSGAIILAIASEYPETQNIGIDFSPDALQYAIQNKKHLSLTNVNFLLGNLLTPFKPGSFDLVIANLPYISEEEYAQLPQDVLTHEPGSALVAGPEGLDDIEVLIDSAASYLKPGGMIILEIGEKQGTKVATFFEKKSDFYKISVKKDLNLLDRFVLAIKLS